MGGSAGLGQFLVQQLLKRGYRVVVFGRDADRLATCQQVFESDFPGACSVEVLDVTDAASVTTRLPQRFERDGRLDLLVNCVGKSCRVAVEEATAEMFQQWMQVNFQSAVNVTVTCLPWLLSQRGGVINIGSLAARVPWRWIAPYAASKQALASFTDSLRIELGDRIRVLLVCPGPIARDDAGQRYAEATGKLAAAANRPGAGAPVKALDPEKLAERTIAAWEAGKAELIVPGKSRFLMLAYAVSVRWGDWLLRRISKD